MKAHTTYNDSDNSGAPLAQIHPASNESVELVLNADVNSGDGRSEWMWVRLANGDLILGVFPQGDTYIEVNDGDASPD